MWFGSQEVPRRHRARGSGLRGDGEASRWDLIKVLGNEAQFRVWVEEFLLPEGVLVERRDGPRYFYRRTERGELLHGLLRSGSMLRILHRVSGRKLR